MTRLFFPQPLPREPSSVALGNLAIAAGVAGCSITLSYQGFPATLLCELWRNCTVRMASQHWLQVFGQRDLRDLRASSSRLRLVLMHNARLIGTLGWTLGLLGSGSCSRPAVLLDTSESDIEEPPGPHLALHSQPAEIAAVSGWLAAGGTSPEWEQLGLPSRIEYDPAVAPVQTDGWFERFQAPLGFGERRLVQSLVLGAAVLRAARQSEDAGHVLEVNVRDYERVRRLLQSPIRDPSVPHVGRKRCHKIVDILPLAIPRQQPSTTEKPPR
jgi:hypothetical protein